MEKPGFVYNPAARQYEVQEPSATQFDLYGFSPEDPAPSAPPSQQMEQPRGAGAQPMYPTPGQGAPPTSGYPPPQGAQSSGHPPSQGGYPMAQPVPSQQAAYVAQPAPRPEGYLTQTVHPPSQPKPKEASGGGGLFGALNRKAAAVERKITEKGLISATVEAVGKVGTSWDVVKHGGTANHFAKIFRMPANEEFYKSFNCSLMYSVRDHKSVSGILYLSQNFVCFQADGATVINAAVRREFGWGNKEISLVINRVNVSAVITTILRKGVTGQAIQLVSKEGHQFLFSNFFDLQSFNEAVRLMGCIMHCAPPNLK